MAPRAWAQSYLIGTNQTACAGTIYDSGGATGDYSNSEDLTSVLTPGTAGAKVALTFTSFATESCCDYLRIYDGPTASAPLIGEYKGTTAPTGAVYASNATGQLTLVFHSDGSVVQSGFAATITCLTNVPTITSFTPTSGPAGTSVVLTGTNFTGATAVTVSGTPAPTFTVNSATQLTFTVPAGAQTGPICVTTPNGRSCSGVNYNTGTLIIGTDLTACTGTIYDSGGATGSYSNDEDLTSVLTPGTPGSKVALTFGSFATESCCDYLRIYDGPTASAPLIGEYKGTAGPASSVFATNTTGQLTLVFHSDGSVIGAGFEAAISCLTNVPTITSFTPTNGPAGTSVVITGTGFTGATGVSFNGLAVPTTAFTVNSATQITATVPVGATTGPVRVTVNGLTVVSSTNFTVPAPTITSFTPTSGLPGTVVVITGTNFTNASAVSFNNVPATTFNVNSATQITVTVPVGATTGAIRVTNGAVAVSGSNFTVPAPTVTSFTPTSGPAGTSVVITGTGFAGATGVTIGGSTVSTFTVNSATQVTATVPANAFTGTVCVTTASGTGCSTATYNTGNQAYLIGANVTACSGTIFDSGGPTGNYSNSEDRTSVLTPGNGSKVVLTFTSFATESCCDYLRIYDGPSASATLIGEYKGTSSPGTVRASASNTTGQLTLVFHSDGSVVQSGFAADISCLAPPTCQPVTNLTVTNVTATTARLNFTPGAGNNSYIVTYTPASGAAQTATGTASPITLTNLSPLTAYSVSIQPVCTVGTSPNTVTTGAFTTLLPNDEPCGAVALSATPVSSSNVTATTSVQNGIFIPSCAGGQLPRDVWFTFVANATTSTLTLTGNPAGAVRVFTAANCSTGVFNEIFCRGSGTNNTTVGTVAVTGLAVGTRYYVAVNGYGSSDTQGNFTIAATNVLATKAQTNSDALVVYPNPSNTGQLTIKLGDLRGAGQVVLINSLGQAVRTQALSGAAEQTLSTHALATGLYTLRVTVGEQVLTRKVVLE